MDDTTPPPRSPRLGFLERWARPTDLPEERLQAVALAGTAMLISVLSIWWVGMYWYLGVPSAAAFPFIYQVVSAASLAYFARTKNIPLFRRSQLLMWLILPLGLQWTLGGFINASAVMLWSIFAPLGALLFQGPARAVPWLVAYGAAIVGMGLAEVALRPASPPLPGWFIIVNFVMNLIAISFVAFAMLRYFALKRAEADAALRREHHLLQEEQGRSEALLLNVLPRPIADRLKRQPSAIADGFAEATVLFADIVDFTRLSAGMPPEQLVTWLNDLFSVFDRLSERHGLEKIKTVGDAYMAAAGVPVPRPDHARAAAEMALEMQDELRRRRAPNGEPLQMRIGLHSGPVVAGVIGTRKFIYDLWGDTVNTASRMESHGLAGTIQVTEAAYQRLRGDYTLEERGTIPVKGKGEMRTYLLTGRRR
ncbi:MAG TPA: adenylate/guanylate cyclase domain-containing protein [bacterium]|nr:adenylate/guanylate cyclase domain-containing protein [bacterium]